MRYLGLPLCLAMGLLLAMAIPSRTAQALDLPAPVAQRDWSPLMENVDNELRLRLLQQVETVADWRSLIKGNKLAIGLVDLSDPAQPGFAEVNGNVEMYAASLPKIAILLASFDAFEKGKLQRTAEIDQDLVAMIRHSSNPAATRMIDRLGGLASINTVLKDPQYRFYDAQSGGGLWVGKRYAKRGPRIPDPLKGISHAATVTQICRFYYQLATGQLINAEASAEMLEILSRPGINHKFVKILRERAPNAALYRKSGTWKQWHADSVLVWGPQGRRYILVALVQSPKGEQVLRRLADRVDAMMGTKSSR